MSNRKHGDKAEREFCRLLGEYGFIVVRAAGSGVGVYTDCDVIAVRDSRTLVVDVKYSSDGEYDVRDQRSIFKEEVEKVDDNVWVGYALRVKGESGFTMHPWQNYVIEPDKGTPLWKFNRRIKDE